MSTARRSCALGAALWLLGAATPSASSAQAPREPGLTASALAGLDRLHLPRTPSPAVAVAASAGYGVTESLGGIDGAHHRAAGTLAASASLLDGLAIALRLDGRHDMHPDDGMGADSGTVGDPRLIARGGVALGETVQLGGELTLWVPGESAPSLAFDAATVDARMLFAHAAPDSPWTFAAGAGFRFDRSARAAPQLDRLRAGDRLALGLSDFDALLVGLGVLRRAGALELFGEAGLDLLVGEGAPALGESPMRLVAGARYRGSARLQLALSLAVSPSARPDAPDGERLVPVEPRFALQAGVRYAFGAFHPGAAPAEPVEPAEARPVPAAAPPAIALVKGRLQDGEGQPIAGARVRLRGAAGELAAETDELGRYRFEDVPAGEAELSAEREGYEPATWTAAVAAGTTELPDRVLERAAAGQLRGLALSFRGKPIAASIRVVPLDREGAAQQELVAGKDGRFSIDLPPGRYRVHVGARGYATQVREVEVAADSVVILNLDLRRARR